MATENNSNNTDAEQLKKLEAEANSIHDLAEDMLKQEQKIKLNQASEQKTMSDNKFNAKTASEKIEVNQGKKGGLTLLSLAVFILFAGTLGGGYYLYEQNQQSKLELNQALANNDTKMQQWTKTQEKLTDELEQKDNHAKLLLEENQKLSTQVESLKQQLASVISAQDEFKATLSKTEEQLKAFEQRDPNDWLIAQSYFLVGNAQNVLSTEGNLEVARLNLQNAQRLIANVKDASLDRIKAQLVNDLTNLNNIKEIDLKLISYKLESLTDNLEKMPLAMLATREDEQGAQENNWKDNLLNAVKGFTSRFIEVKRKDDPLLNQFMSQEQLQFLLANLKNQLLLAKLQLFAKNEESFNKNLVQIKDKISEYFDLKDQVVINNLQIIDELNDTKLEGAKPIIESYVLFNQLANEKFKLEENSSQTETTVALENDESKVDDKAKTESQEAL